MKKEKISKKTEMSSAVFAATAKAVFDDLIKQGFTTDQAFQLTRDVVQAMTR